LKKISNYNDRIKERVLFFKIVKVVSHKLDKNIINKYAPFKSLHDLLVKYQSKPLLYILKDYLVRREILNILHNEAALQIIKSNQKGVLFEIFRNFGILAEFKEDILKIVNKDSTSKKQQKFSSNTNFETRIKDFSGVLDIPGERQNVIILFHDNEYDSCLISNITLA